MRERDLKLASHAPQLVEPMHHDRQHVAVDFVEPELNVGDFGGDCVDGGERPAGEVAHGFGGIDLLGAGGFVDRQRIAAECLRLRVYVWDFSFDGAARRSRMTTARCLQSLRSG